jgi:hypothetical protein
LIELRELLGSALLAFGVLLMGAGVIYWLNGWRVGLAVMLLTLTLGLLCCGAGARLRWPASRRARQAALACFVGSAVAFILLQWAGAALLALGATAILGAAARSLLARHRKP